MLFDSSATHSFISSSCAEKLKVSMSSLNDDLMVVILTNGSVLIYDVCLNCLVEISGRKFLIDLICLPLSQIDVILDMDWLSSNHVLLNYFDKTMVLGDFEVSRDRIFISTNQFITSLKEDAQVYMILSNLEVESKVSMSDLPVVREFPEVFTEDLSGLPPGRDRVFYRSSTWCRRVSISLYKMSHTELVELKK